MAQDVERRGRVQHNGVMSTTMERVRAQEGTRGPGVSTRAIVGSIVLAAGVLPILSVFPHGSVNLDASLPIYGWIPIGVAGVVVLDRRPADRLGSVIVVAAMMPLFVFGWAMLRLEVTPSAAAIQQSVGELGPIVVLPLAALALAVADAADRRSRRWGFWITLVSLAVLAVGVATWSLGLEHVYGVTTAAGMLVVSFVVGASAYGQHPRPLDESFLDVGLVAAIGVIAGATYLAMNRWTTAESVTAYPSALAAIVAASTLPLSAIGALWVRQELGWRRYGRGVLTPAEVAAITADLGSGTDPRQLLSKAASITGAAAGNLAVRIVLDDDVEDGWTSYPLLVGAERIGTLLVRPTKSDGLEFRHERTLEQLVPTVSLVARAVGLAIDARYAKDDIVHQREIERARMLADLHDDLGPLLAAMSMKVQAAQLAHDLPMLQALALDLTTCRTDLRRIVAGLVPSALHGAGTADALTNLVSAFGPPVELAGEVPDDLSTELAVLAYRVISEGVNNALRHARPGRVTVAVARRGQDLSITVADDGRGGPIVPGVGLSSLRARAEELGGWLSMITTDAGTRLEARVPRATT